MSSYAFLWSDPRWEVESGKLELEPGGLRFEGSRSRRRANVRRLGYREIERVRIGRREQERLCGRPSSSSTSPSEGPCESASSTGRACVVSSRTN